MASDRSKRITQPSKMLEGFFTSGFGTSLGKLLTPLRAMPRPENISESVERSSSDSQSNILKSSQRLQLFHDPASPPSSPSQTTDLQAVLDGQKELKNFKVQVTDELKVEVRQFIAEMQQTLQSRIELEVEHKVSEKLAPVQ